ncbi:ankyrin repeat domain-containing protein [Marinobacter sp. VGCF2001]|uniref:ankyrin repeat domain-containing protein n=1 Tax=Marinobacter sp. VGCF2001 TaxID=3417189 RepID=UPI003CEA61C0
MEFWERWSGMLGAVLALALLLGLWMFLGEGENLEARDSRGRTPLIVAAEQGETERVAELVEQGAHVDAGDDCNWTAMMRAASRGHAETLAFLLDHGAEINHTDKTGYTALMGAVIANRPDAVRLLLARGANPDIQEYENGQTALMMAVRNRNPELVSLLLSAGADPELVNKAGKSARDLALTASAGERAPMPQILEALGCEPGAAEEY